MAPVLTKPSPLHPRNGTHPGVVPHVSMQVVVEGQELKASVPAVDQRQSVQPAKPAGMVDVATAPPQTPFTTFEWEDGNPISGLMNLVVRYATPSKSWLTR